MEDEKKRKIGIGENYVVVVLFPRRFPVGVVYTVRSAVATLT